MTNGPGAAPPDVGWQPDPFRRHELRFRDGDHWTEHVSDRGIAGVDSGPVAGGPPSRPAEKVIGSGAPPVASGTVKVLPETTPGPVALSDARILVVEALAGGAGPSGRWAGASGQRSEIDRAVTDEHGDRVGTVRVGGEGLGSRALRLLTTSVQREITEVDVFDLHGSVVLSLDRPARFLKPRTVVTRGDGSTVGSIVPERLVSGLLYRLESPDGALLATIARRMPLVPERPGEQVEPDDRELPNDRELEVRDPAGVLVARVSTTWEVLAGRHHPDAGTYLVLFEHALPEPFRSLVLAALLALDSLLVRQRSLRV